MSKFVEEFTKKIVSVQPLKHIDYGLAAEALCPGILTEEVKLRRKTQKEHLTKCGVAKNGHCNSSEFGCCLELVCEEFKRHHDKIKRTNRRTNT